MAAVNIQQTRGFSESKTEPRSRPKSSPLTNNTSVSGSFLGLLNTVEAK